MINLVEDGDNNMFITPYGPQHIGYKGQRGAYPSTLMAIIAFQRQTLLDAQQHPEQYRDLVVRVAGYSAFFVELIPAVQDEIISRTEQAL